MRLKGYFLAAAAAVSYGLNPAFALPLYADGMNPDSVLALRYGFAILLVALMMFGQRRSFRIERRQVLPLACLGVLMALSSLLLFCSYHYMAAGIASTILFVYPVFVALLMTLFRGERLTWTTVVCLVTASAGIWLLYHSGETASLSMVGTLLVIASAVSYAVYLVWIGNRQMGSLSTLTLTFYVLCFGSLLFVGRLVAGVSAFTVPSEWYLWLDAFALALFPTAISLLCTKAAIRLIGSTPTAIFGALEPVTALVVGMVFFHEGMTLREAFGILLVLLAVVMIVSRGKESV